MAARLWLLNSHDHSRRGASGFNQQWMRVRVHSCCLFLCLYQHNSIGNQRRAGVSSSHRSHSVPISLLITDSWLRGWDILRRHETHKLSVTDYFMNTRLLVWCLQTPSAYSLHACASCCTASLVGATHHLRGSPLVLQKTHLAFQPGVTYIEAGSAAAASPRLHHLTANLQQ